MTLRKALVHVGTHKTGTKTIQMFYSDNLDALRNAGLYVPDAGRIMMGENQATPGHHALATALASGDKTILEAFAREIKAANAPSILISSEEFHPLAANPELLVELQRRIVALGYDPVVILCLRPQAEYAQSLYAEIAKNKSVTSYSRFLASIMEHGALYPDASHRIYFEYSRIVEGLSLAFGFSNIVVRAYDDSLPTEGLVADFMSVVEAIRGPIDASTIVRSPHVNRRLAFATLINAIHETIAAENREAPSPWQVAQQLGIEATDWRLGMPFFAMSYEEREAMRSRFSADNQKIESMTGTRILDRVIAPNDPSWDIAAFQRRFLDAAFALWFK